MFVGAVTGTNGKTSTVEFARQFMLSSSQSAASLGTFGLTGPDGGVADPHLPPGSGAIPVVIDDLIAQGVGALFIEAYSSALQARLLDETRVQAGAFTNLSADHLNVHGSLYRYYQAKTRLFTDVIVTGGSAVINADASEFEDLSARCRARSIDITSYGRSPRADLQLLETHLDPHTPLQSKVDLVFFGRRFSTELKFGAEFMVANALCAAGLAMAAGLDESAAAAGLAQLTAPRGRMQWVAEHKGAHVVVDYAHTPDGMRAALHALRAITLNRVLLVFGCGGDRDHGRRTAMGHVATELADVVIVTDDNPRQESAAEIRTAITSAVPTAHEIPNRAEAIGYALRLLRSGDVLLVAGKGHEQFQEVLGEQKPFSDQYVIEEQLRDLQI